MLDEQLLEDLDCNLSAFISEPSLGGDPEQRNSLLKQLVTVSRDKDSSRSLISEEKDFLDTCVSFIRAAKSINWDQNTTSVSEILQFFSNICYHCEDISKLEFLGLKSICSTFLDEELKNDRLGRLSIELIVKVSQVFEPRF